MKKYEEPMMEILIAEEEDIITASTETLIDGGIGNGDGGNFGDWAN